MGPKRGLHETYKFYRNLSSKLIRKAKLGHYREYVETNKDNPNKLANYLMSFQVKTEIAVYIH